jgi:PAS domain S-box-containing protein
MEKLTKYLVFIRENFLEEVAKDNLRIAREMNLPIMKIVEGMPEDLLIEQGKKSICDFADQLADGTYIQKRNESLKKWENDELPELKNHSLEAEDLILIYPLQRKMFYNFLPRYTQDVELTIHILELLDDLHTASQLDAVKILMKKQKKTEEQFRQSSNFLNTVLENIPNMIFVKDAKDLRFVRFNRAGEELLGHSREDLIGKNDYDFFPKEQADFFTAKDRDVLEKGKLLDIPEEPVNTLTKGERWLHTKKLPVMGEDGKPAFLMGISEDITEHKKAEDALKKTMDNFLKIFSLSPVVTHVTDAETGRFILVNEVFEKTFQMKKEDVIGKTVVELKLLSHEEREKTAQRVRDQNGVIKDLEVRMRIGDGSMRDMYISSDMIEMDGRKCFVATMFDITQRKRTEEKISQLNKDLNDSVYQLNSVNKELEAFTYSVSHDLRAPLRAVNGYANMLEEDYGERVDNEGKRLLEVIRYNAEKMGRLIDDLLAFSKLGRKEIETSDEDINKLVEGVLIDLNKSVSHNAEIKTGKLHSIKVDYGMMHQALFNLISNAVKYSSKKEKPLIEINSEKTEHEIIISVKDNGVGFDMQYVDKLFGVFQRLHAMDEFEGTGVGLAIVQRIVAKHKGRVWAEAKVNKGATFFIALPI